NEIKLNTWVTGAIASGKDADTFAFTTPETYRDKIRIELQNRSTTLEPKLELFDNEKTSIGSIYKTTPGADVAYVFASKPATSYAVRLSNYYGESTGLYLVRVAPMKAYDASEPNDDILHAKPIAVGATVAANIMDKSDYDYYAVTAGAKEVMMVASLK